MERETTLSVVCPRRPLGIFAGGIDGPPVGVVIFDEIQPVVLHSGRGIGIDLAIVVARWRVGDIIGTPQSTQLDGMGNAQPRGHLLRILNVPSIYPSIVPVLRDGRANIHARTHVTGLLIHIASVSPIAADGGTAVVWIRIHVVNLPEHIQCELRILVQYIVITLLKGGGIFRSELGPPIGIVAIDGGDFDEISFLKYSICEILYKFLVEHRQPHIIGRPRSTWQRNIVIACLKLHRCLVAHTGEIVFADAAYARCKLGIHVLRLSNCKSRSKGWRLSNGGMEEASVGAVIGG